MSVPVVEIFPLPLIPSLPKFQSPVKGVVPSCLNHNPSPKDSR